MVNYLTTSFADRVRFPKSEIWRYVFSGFHQHPESLRMKLCGIQCQGFAQECRVTWEPHQVQKCKKSVEHTCARPSRAVEPSRSGGQDERPDKVVTTERWGERVKCRMKCFYETRSHGPQDQDFDGNQRIHISRFLTSGIEPEPRGS